LKNTQNLLNNELSEYLTCPQCASPLIIIKIQVKGKNLHIEGVCRKNHKRKCNISLMMLDERKLLVFANRLCECPSCKGVIPYDFWIRIRILPDNIREQLYWERRQSINPDYPTPSYYDEINCINHLNCLEEHYLKDIEKSNLKLILPLDCSHHKDRISDFRFLPNIYNIYREPAYYLADSKNAIIEKISLGQDPSAFQEQVFKILQKLNNDFERGNLFHLKLHNDQLKVIESKNFSEIILFLEFIIDKYPPLLLEINILDSILTYSIKFMTLYLNDCDRSAHWEGHVSRKGRLSRKHRTLVYSWHPALNIRLEPYIVRFFELLKGISTRKDELPIIFESLLPILREFFLKYRKSLETYFLPDLSQVIQTIFNNLSHYLEQFPKSITQNSAEISNSDTERAEDKAESLKITLEMLYDLTPRQFEMFIIWQILPNLGYSEPYLTPYTADSGYDGSVKQSGKLVLVECKKFSPKNKVGVRDVRNLADACLRLNATQGIFITTSVFTKAALNEQRARSFKIEFWNGKELMYKINQVNLDKLDLGRLQKIEKIERTSKSRL